MEPTRTRKPARKTPGVAKPAIRTNDLAQIHIAKKDLNWDDDFYRAQLRAVCQVDSSRQLDMAGRRKFLDYLQRCGWKPTTKAGKPSRKKLSPMAGKCYSLWQQLHEANLLTDKSFAALEKWAKGQTSVDKLEWNNGAQFGQLIESLKAWLARGKEA